MPGSEPAAKRIRPDGATSTSAVARPAGSPAAPAAKAAATTGIGKAIAAVAAATEKSDIGELKARLSALKEKAAALEQVQKADAKLSAYPLLVQLEEKVPGVPHFKVALIGGLAFMAVLFFYFFMGMKFICDMTGFAYPTYMSFKAIETEDKEDDKQWLTY